MRRASEAAGVFFLWVHGLLEFADATQLQLVREEQGRLQRRREEEEQ